MAAPPRLRRGYSVEASRGAAAAATRTFRGETSWRHRYLEATAKPFDLDDRLDEKGPQVRPDPTNPPSFEKCWTGGRDGFELTTTGARRYFWRDDDDFEEASEGNIAFRGSKSFRRLTRTLSDPDPDWGLFFVEAGPRAGPDSCEATLNGFLGVSPGAPLRLGDDDWGVAKLLATAARDDDGSPCSVGDGPAPACYAAMTTKLHAYAPSSGNLAIGSWPCDVPREDNARRPTLQRR